ncbi:STAS domain-containing protein [Idiomarina abyssalis]|uniref:STAS domain-containing protein n=1 Tax=Idiomarina abyssalis TaxID=86102 RepID=UPI0006C8E0E8|nr:STAS domain-containing protein [Idiomarina abyssalis]KPD22953.1 anti-anti-sigma regulatory factor [Idiomarina abyssalis]SFT50686.1 anti-anti-sigma factor [Idiomarina abyssalis]
MSVSRDFSNDDKQLVIAIKGKFDFSLVQEFRQAYSHIGDSQPTVIIDLRETDYLDSSALGMLLNMRKSLGSSVKGIQLVNAKPDVRRILDISRFDKMFVIA